MKTKFLVLLGLALLVFVAGCLQPPQAGSSICTLDAKQCPDGSYVSRDPANNCEFFACQQGEIPQEFSVTLERQGCYGTCPIYKVTVKADGSVTYIGERFVGTTGEQTSAIGLDKVKQLLGKIKAMDYFSLNREYTQGATFDAGSAVTRVTMNGQKEILHAFEDTSAPVELTELEDFIDEITNSDQWIQPVESQTQWLSYVPVQCQTNPWEVWHADQNRQYVTQPSEEDIVEEYYSTAGGVEILGYQHIPDEPGTGACAACECPRGDTIKVLVSGTDSEKMREFGWKNIGEGITLKTSKASYAQGEEIEFVLSNEGTNNKITYSTGIGYCGDESDITVFKRTENGFVKIYFGVKCEVSLYARPEWAELEPQSKATIKIKLGSLEQGTYKASLPYKLNGFSGEYRTETPEFKIVIGEAGCIESGGEWKAHCGLIADCCNYRTTDFGNACTDSEQCEGDCIAVDANSSEGTCSEWKTKFGCFNSMEDGQVNPVCVD